MLLSALKKYGAETDAVLLLLHMGTGHPEAAELQTLLRQRFCERWAHEVPILTASAHTHALRSGWCESAGGVKDMQCYNTEAGCYGRSLKHTVFVFGDDTHGRTELRTEYYFP